MTEVEELPVEERRRRPLLERVAVLANPVVLVVLILDAVLLAWLELLFLPLRVWDFWPDVPRAYNWPLPVTILIAAVTTPWLVLAAARCSSRMIVVALPFLAWLGAVVVFGVAGPGGDVLLTDDWRSLVLLSVGSLAGAAALGTRLTLPQPR
ncbi:MULTISPECIES: hypothetical protein [unclassified Crossiella]|uniref:hypothetical protein n=1 Tax=unclassified Crossiella TaxID=2620835 RepID=UPI001FFF6F7D|nr:MULTISPECIES: hypothetical protein [unclassified Crossiella]MCK2237190.1 hypothetical protein [Crossiella sp. S99.2]MCK2250845.1 hypothetical protein [Crossiella sp. S99.1]